MAYTDPNEAYEDFKTKTLAGLQQFFPVVGKQRVLELSKLDVQETGHPDAVNDQLAAKLKGELWGEPVYGTFDLKDKETGKVLETRRMRIAQIPRMTKRYSYVAGGNEYQVENQWQLRQGVYVRRDRKGQPKAQFNVRNGKNFEMHLDPESQVLTLKWNSANLPAYPVMRALGVTDGQLEHAWGSKVLEANKRARGGKNVLDKIYKAELGKMPSSSEEAAGYVQKLMEGSWLDAGVTKHTLGEPHENITGKTLVQTSKRLFDVHKGAPEDDIDALVFKRLRTAADFASDKFKSHGKEIRTKMMKQIDDAPGGIRGIVRMSHFMPPIHKTFTQNAASQVAKQINPLEMVSAAGQTTVMGPGGMTNDNQVTEETKLINPTHFGFLDPLNTPEGGRSGVSLRLPFGVRQVRGVPHLPLYDMAQKKAVLVPIEDAVKYPVALPDQVTWNSDGTPKAKKATIKLLGRDNEVVEGKLSDAKYVLKHSGQVFGLTTNLIPFLHSTQGNRSGMAARHLEQATSLVHREAPLVQVGTGFQGGLDTFEKIVGRQTGHTAPVDGTVVSVSPTSIKIQDAAGKVHESQLYHNYPVTDAKSFLHSTPLVEKGAHVKRGQPIADHNYSKDGQLALGASLRVGYLPMAGYNFEDGIVISDSAAKKLTSQHMHKELYELPAGASTDPGHFRNFHSGTYTKQQLDALPADGVVRVGQKVMPGDPLILASIPFEAKRGAGLGAIRKTLSGVHTDKSLRWESDFPGVVTHVERKGDKIRVHVRTEECVRVGDKLAGRYGNKGVVTAILADSEMPRGAKGEHIEVALNPSGVPGRINVGQIYETVAGKIAQKTGKPYVVHNFSGGDQLAKLKADAAKHKVRDTEELFDPKTGHSIGQVTTGPEYMLKLVHQVEKQGSVRSGMTLPGEEPEKYDENLQPKGGGHAGGQRFGSLGVWGLLAHGATANLREAQTLKSEGPEGSGWKQDPSWTWKSKHREAWEAIQLGMPLPPPQPTFAFKKFESYLKGAGINLEKKGHQLILSPLTDKQILKMSAGEVKHPDLRTTYADDGEGNPKPIPGGLFDPKVTGGHGGKKWSHIRLAEPVPNPIFEKPICALLGMRKIDMLDVVHGKKSVGADGRVLEDAKSGLTGGAAIKHMLGRIDVEKELAKAAKDLTKAPTAKVNSLLQKTKYLQALQNLGMKADEAYVLHHLPVLPPIMRPTAFNKNGRLDEADMNALYARFGQVNKQLANPVTQTQMTDALKQPLRESFYDGVKAMMGFGVPYPEKDKPKGLLHQVAGKVPKEGMFQKMLLSKRQDLAMRAAIVPEPSLGLDEVGLPEHYAQKLFRPFVVKKMVDLGYAKTSFEAQKLIAEKHPTTRKALEAAMEDHPVLLKRDPALHKYSIQGFNPVLTTGKALKIHPLVVTGFNADFDGDRMAAFLPVTPEAIAEARKMRPSDNLFSDATGKLTYLPTLEASLGLYKLGRIGAQTSHKAPTFADAIKLAHSGKVGINDVLEAGGVKTTPGRILLASALPQPLQHSVLTGTEPMHSKNVAELLSRVGKEFKGEFGTVANKFKDMGNGAAYGLVPILHPEYRTEKDLKKPAVIPIGAHTLTLDDFEPDRKLRDGVLRAADKKVQAIRRNKKLTTSEQDARVFEEWMKADGFIGNAHNERASKNPSNLFAMKAAGVKPNMTQYKQLVLSPMIVNDSLNQPILSPIRHSYSEGLDLGEYWVGAYGARRGLVRKVQEVQKPGTMTKELQNVSMDQLIVGDDCGTKNGIMMHVMDRDIHDRYLAKDATVGNMSLPAGTLLTPDLVGRVRQVKKDMQLPVRSSLRCAHTNGICQKCYGLAASGKLPDIGTNVGVIAAHSLGERTTQLTLKEFHCLHEQTIVLVRQYGITRHITLGQLFASQHASYAAGEHAALPEGLEVATRDGWTRVKAISRHPQQEGTAMVLTRTRSGNFLLSQDNHPHMLRENSAVCPACRTIPKRSNGGKQYYCRKCGHKWQGVPPDTGEYSMVEPAVLRSKSHRALCSDNCQVTPCAPPVQNGWLCGMYCAEGWIHAADGVPRGIGFGQNTGDTLTRLERAITGEYPGLHQSSTSGGVVLYNTEISQEYLRNFGRYSRNVGLPAGWSGYPDGWLFDFVSGVIDGDGSVFKQSDSQWWSVHVATTSLLLAEQIRFILRKLNMFARTSLATHRTLTTHQGYVVAFTVSQALKDALPKCDKLKRAPGNPEPPKTPSFEDVVDYVRPVYFSTPPVVYDLETEAGTLFANGMWTHNSGGVAGGKQQVSGAFEQLHDLLGLRKELPRQATLATVSGKIEKIEDTGTGSNIWVNGTKHFVGKDAAGRSLIHGSAPEWDPPKVGLQVRPGQPLSDPSRTTVNPRHLYSVTGSLPAFQQHMIGELDKLFKEEGVHKKHHEVLVRAMTSTGKVSDPGDAKGLLRGEIAGIGHMQDLNTKLVAEGKSPIRFIPNLQGIAELPLSMREDWMAKLMHRQLRTTIADAVAKGAVSNLHGTHPIPGLAYSAEFGFNAAQAKRPGMERLHDVPHYAY